MGVKGRGREASRALLALMTIPCHLLAFIALTKDVGGARLIVLVYT